VDLIVGMDLGVFLAWIGTIGVTILCIIYGLYYQFIKKSDEKQHMAVPKKQEKQEEDQ